MDGDSGRCIMVRECKSISRICVCLVRIMEAGHCYQLATRWLAILVNTAILELCCWLSWQALNACRNVSRGQTVSSNSIPATLAILFGMKKVLPHRSKVLIANTTLKNGLRKL